jgi:hypothetical protein
VELIKYLRKGKAMEKFFLSVLLGLLTPLFLIGVGETLGLLPGFLVMGFYVAVCQFLMARREARLPVNILTPVGMGVPLIGFFILIAMVEKHEVLMSQGVPMLLAGTVGIAVGAWAARMSRKKKLLA